jgi:hypothetical protein
MSSDKEPMSLDKEPMSSDKETMSLDKESMSSDKETMSLDKEPMSSDKETMSLDKESMSSDKETMSLDKEPMSLDKEPMSLDKEPMSLDKEPMSLDKEPMSSDKEAMSSDKGAMSLDIHPMSLDIKVLFDKRCSSTLMAPFCVANRACRCHACEGSDCLFIACCSLQLVRRFFHGDLFHLSLFFNSDTILFTVVGKGGSRCLACRPRKRSSLPFDNANIRRRRGSGIENVNKREKIVTKMKR